MDIQNIIKPISPDTDSQNIAANIPNNTDTSNQVTFTLHPMFESILAMNKKYSKLYTRQTATSNTPPKPPTTISKINSSKNHATNGTVDPIKDLADIEAMKQYFLSKSQYYKNNPTNIRNYALVVFTINCSRRIGDVLKLTKEDVIDSAGTFRYYIGKEQKKGITEQKTHKDARVPICEAAQEALKMYFDTLDTINLEDPIFKSRKTKDINKAKQNYLTALKTGIKVKYKAIRYQIAVDFTRTLEPRSVSKLLKDMSRKIGLESKGININTHSLRKTKPFFVYQSTKDLELCSRMLNHELTDPKVTRRYIGIGQDESDKGFLSFNL